VNVIGISAYYHESACALLRDGRLVAAAEEERFSRVKHDASLPVSAFRFCLEAGGLDVTDVDCVAFYESPVKKLGRQLWAGRPPGSRPWLDPLRAEREIREVLGFEGRLETFDHHASHAASAFYFSGFGDAAVLTVDGVGEWATTTYGRGEGDELTSFEEVEFPDSLGLFYSAITAYLGFRVNGGEYKVMGLAPYGAPRLLEAMRTILRDGPAGGYSLDPECFDFVAGPRMFAERLADRLGGPPRAPEAELTVFHHDVARSAQARLEEVLLDKVRYLYSVVPSRHLCMAGGVALNCVINGRILREGPFERLFVQPAAGDAGGSLGAAALAHRALTGARPHPHRLEHVYLGPRFPPDTIADLLEAAGIEALDFRGRQAALLQATVDRLAAGQVVGWFHGAMEFGPRALGARSILADPRVADMRERLNRLVKRREAFRPFAPSVLLAHAAEHFELDQPSPFMLQTCGVRSPLALPAVTHVDGSARPQTVDPAHAPRFAALLHAFVRRTGCPVLLNTSFNVRDEPIVCSPADALACLAGTEIDALVLEDFVVDRARLPRGVSDAAARGEARRARASGVSAVLYTFV
jgi:carbamoyltransferase